MSRDFRKSKVCIYTVGHKQFAMPVKDSVYIPLMVGKQQGEFSNGWISEHTGDHISDKNVRYNELTGLYWIWKNANAEITGLCHYRRFFVRPCQKAWNVLTGKPVQVIDEPYIKKILSSYHVILHNKTFTPGGNQNQLCMKQKCSETGNSAGLSREILTILDDTFKRSYPKEFSIYEHVMNRKYAHLLNMMICRKEILGRYCEWLFPLLYQIEDEIDRQFPGQAHARCMGLIGERLLDVWVLKEKLRVKECFAMNTERRDWKPW